MAATVLNSPRAVQMSLFVIRAFVALRQLATEHKALFEKLDELDARVGAHDEQIAAILAALRELVNPERRVWLQARAASSFLEDRRECMWPIRIPSASEDACMRRTAFIG